MNISDAWAATARHWITVLALSILAGCASVYVDSNTKEIDASQFKKPNSTHAVQFLFEFQTNGVPNDFATHKLRPLVVDQIQTSGLFSSVSEDPVSTGALLGVVVNNVPLTDDVMSKGFVTGLTLGVVGSSVSDGYICTARYWANANSAPITKQARHAIHTSLGTGSPPEGAVKAASNDEAVSLMLHQVISNVLNDLSHDAAFK